MPIPTIPAISVTEQMLNTKVNLNNFSQDFALYVPVVKVVGIEELQ